METRQQERHFKFGENWESFTQEISAEMIDEATTGLLGLVPSASLTNRRFLDIGCGSGLSMLAALRAGASHAHGIDFDPVSVTSARELLSRHAASGTWSVEEGDIFTFRPDAAEPAGVVHSWGVLHHTGNMKLAIEKAAALVPPGGVFVIALYHHTPFCGMWRVEKRLYSAAPAWVQKPIRGSFKTAILARRAIAGVSPRRYLREYGHRRGMSWHHDVHDWLGGYPYESARPADIVRALKALGLEPVKTVVRDCLGFLGTTCDEYVARRPE